MGRLSRQKINKETLDFSYTLHKMDLTDIHRTFHLKAAEHMSISSAHRTFSRINHMLGHKTGLSKFLKIELIPYLFYQNVMKLEINNRRKGRKFLSMWKLNNTLLNNQCDP